MPRHESVWPESVHMPAKPVAEEVEMTPEMAEKKRMSWETVDIPNVPETPRGESGPLAVELIAAFRKGKALSVKLNGRKIENVQNSVRTATMRLLEKEPYGHDPKTLMFRYRRVDENTVVMWIQMIKK